MKKLATLMLLALLMGCSQGATSVQKGTILVGSIDELTYRVADRHDSYVSADQGLSDSERADYLRSTELLRKVMQEASEE